MAASLPLDFLPRNKKRPWQYLMILSRTVECSSSAVPPWFTPTMGSALIGYHHILCNWRMPNVAPYSTAVCLMLPHNTPAIFLSALRGPFNSLHLQPFSASGLSVSARGIYSILYCFYLHFYGLFVRYLVVKKSSRFFLKWIYHCFFSLSIIFFWSGSVNLL